MICAAKRGRTDMVRLLLEHGADVDLVDVVSAARTFASIKSLGSLGSRGNVR